MTSTSRRAVVTGAAGGIGTAVARRLAADGWRLHLIDVNDAGLQRLKAELPAHTTSAVSPMGSPDECAASIAAIDGPIEALVHLAGIFVAHDLSPRSREVYDRTIQNNASNAYDLSCAVLPRMPDGAAFVFTSSLGFNRGNIEEVSYSMAKGAVVGLMRALARRLAPRGIRSNAIAPGIIESPMATDLIARRGSEALLSGIPMRRFGTPVEVAGVVSFLLSDDAAYVTGQVINVDGGVINN